MSKLNELHKGIMGMLYASANKQPVFILNDGQDWAYTDIESALEHIRQGVIDQVRDGDEYTITVKFMTPDEISGLSEQ